MLCIQNLGRLQARYTNLEGKKTSLLKYTERDITDVARYGYKNAEMHEINSKPLAHCESRDFFVCF